MQVTGRTTRNISKKIRLVISLVAQLRGICNPPIYSQEIIRTKSIIAQFSHHPIQILFIYFLTVRVYISEAMSDWECGQNMTEVVH